MSDLYDEQFRRRVQMHLMVCDPVSTDIIAALVRYVEHPELRDSASPQVQSRLELAHREMHLYLKSIGNSVCELCEALERVAQEK